MQSDEAEPEVDGSLQDADDADEHDEGEDEEGGVGAGVDVRVPGLVDLQHAQYGDHVHEGSVCRATGNEGRGGGVS